MEHSMWKFLLFVYFIFVQFFTAVSIPSTLAPENCKVLPKIKKFKLLECCGLPEFFKQEIREKCVAECSHNSENKQDPWCCMTKCTFEEAELGSNGAVSKSAAKSYFRKLFNSTEIRKAVDSSLTKCENEGTDPQTESCEYPQYGSLLSCLHRELFKHCFMVKTNPTCLKIKNFIKKCPSRKDELFDL